MKYQMAAATKATRMTHHQFARPLLAGAAGAGAGAGAVVCARAAETAMNIEAMTVANGIDIVEVSCHRAGYGAGLSLQLGAAAAITLPLGRADDPALPRGGALLQPGSAFQQQLRDHSPALPAEGRPSHSSNPSSWRSRRSVIEAVADLTQRRFVRSALMRKIAASTATTAPSMRSTRIEKLGAKLLTESTRVNSICDPHVPRCRLLPRP